MIKCSKQFFYMIFSSLNNYSVIFNQSFQSKIELYFTFYIHLYAFFFYLIQISFQFYTIFLFQLILHLIFHKLCHPLVWKVKTFICFIEWIGNTQMVAVSIKNTNYWDILNSQVFMQKLKSTSSSWQPSALTFINLLNNFILMTSLSAFSSPPKIYLNFFQAKFAKPYFYTSMSQRPSPILICA